MYARVGIMTDVAPQCAGRADQRAGRRSAARAACSPAGRTTWRPSAPVKIGHREATCVRSPRRPRRGRSCRHDGRGGPARRRPHRAGRRRQRWTWRRGGAGRGNRGGRRRQRIRDRRRHGRAASARAASQRTDRENYGNLEAARVRRLRAAARTRTAARSRHEWQVPAPRAVRRAPRRATHCRRIAGRIRH